ncbi:plasmid mobilization protein [Desulfovibrio litoralis]|uniref:Ribbon-helix-helix protein, copG family n=1 Tax=Desulfovibrio litoralis DSM 11393 TaxID=1121455 RepID=A0A1M7TLT8_9BACT|nr:hypothetical protein [Desulfovibrio litoralis]SHN71709.1 hypothetical protein SAMN02745728_02232 [Desulfovibrio litoralis DSM 11393]
MKLEIVEKICTRKFPITMTFRCTLDDRDVIKKRSAETGNSISTFLRKRAVGGRTSAPIQDSRDLAELRQHMGLLKTLVKVNSEVRPLLKAVEHLIAKMTEKVG